MLSGFPRLLDIWKMCETVSSVPSKNLSWTQLPSGNAKSLAIGRIKRWKTDLLILAKLHSLYCLMLLIPVAGAIQHLQSTAKITVNLCFKSIPVFHQLISHVLRSVLILNIYKREQIETTRLVISLLLSASGGAGGSALTLLSKGSAWHSLGNEAD